MEFVVEGEREFFVFLFLAVEKHLEGSFTEDTYTLKSCYLVTSFINLKNRIGNSHGIVVKNLLAMQETQVLSLGRKDPLEKEMVTHSSTLAWKISRTGEPGELQSVQLQTAETTEHTHEEQNM